MTRNVTSCRRPASWTILWGLLVSGTLICAAGESPSAPPSNSMDRAAEFYVRKPNLQETMLATRAAYAAALPAQSAARAAATFGPWHLATTSMDGQALAAGKIDLTVRSADGKPAWQPQPDWKDGALFEFAGATAVLGRTISATNAVTLLVGTGGGDRLELFVNGQRVLDADTAIHYGRYGTSMRLDGSRVDQVVVGLPLTAGENVLVMKLSQNSPGPRQAFFSVTPNPVPFFWRQLENDFPRSVNHLLELVRFDWFRTDGWFAQSDARFEQQFLDGVLQELGDRAAAIREQRSQLDAAAAWQDPRWLNLCVSAAELAWTLRGLDRLRASVEHLAATYPERYPGADFRRRLDEFERRVLAAAADGLDPRQEATVRLAGDLDSARREMLLAANPLLKDESILFVKRVTYDSQHFYDDYYHGLRRYGSQLCRLSLNDGKITDVLPQLDEGIIERFDLSFDAARVVFGYRRPKPEGFRLWETRLDGSELRQLTFESEDESDRIARYSLYPQATLEANPSAHGHWTDDLHPCYLPSGEIVFASSRCERTAVCGGHTLPCTVLYKINPDGSGMQRLSQGMLSEFTPTVLNDGRILYTRWEYVYKGIAAIQPLWVIRPDGSGSEEIYGDSIRDPGVFYQARQIPGQPHQIVCTGVGHEPLAGGSILLLDLKRDKRTPAVMTSLTPDTEVRNLRGLVQRRNGKWNVDDLYGPFFCDPFPLSDKYFLVSCNPDRRYNDESAYGIYLLDAFGNLVPIHHDAERSCFEPVLIQPRPVPPVLPASSLPGAVAAKPTENPDNASAAGEATVFLADVYRGLPGVRRGEVKYLRILRQIQRPWSVWPYASDDAWPGQMVAVSWYSHIWVAVLEGIVPVHEDGSAHFTVPADCNLYFQALDGDLMEIQRMRTFVNFRPGEQRSCIGCHEPRTQPPTAASGGLAVALRQPPVQPGPQPGEIAPRPLNYEADVQPIWDRHCVTCHGNTAPEGGLALTGNLTSHFNRSYEQLLSKELVKVAIEWSSPPGRGNSWYWSMEHAPPIPPKAFGSHASRLIKVIREGHYDVRLSAPEFVKLATWVDTNGQYYGSYFGHRNLRYRERSDFRPAPTLASAYGHRPGWEQLAPQPPVPAQLIGHWTFDEGQGTMAADVSGQDHHGTLHAANWTPGVRGGAVAFSGNDAFVRVGDWEGEFETLSVAFWVRVDSHPNRWNPILFCDDWSEQDLHLSVLNEGQPNAAINNGSSAGNHRAADTSVADGQWHHVVLVCDQRQGGSVQFFVDGRPNRKHKLFMADIPLRLTGVRLGGYNVWEKTPGANFHGALDDFRIYRGQLTEKQVAELAAGR